MIDPNLAQRPLDSTTGGIDEIRMPDDRIQAIHSIHPVSPATWHRLKKAPAKQRIRLLDGVLDAVLPELQYRYGNRGKQTDSP